MEKITALNALVALSQETRLDIFKLLVTQGKSGLSAGAIGESLGVANATLSFHLNHLRHADLVVSQRNGTQIIYRANFAVMNGLIAYLTENCCQGDSTGCAPATLCECDTH